MTGSAIQMPQAGFFSVQHRRLMQDYGVEHAVFKAANERDFWNGNDRITGKPDLSKFWYSVSASIPSGQDGTGIWQVTNPYHDQQLTYDKTWCGVTGSTTGLLGSEVIPALEPNVDNYAYMFNPVYVPTTNELWFIGSGHTGGVFVGDMGNSTVATDILRVDADGSPGDAVNVDSHPNSYWFNQFFGGSISDYFQCNIKYGHVRDCIWSYTRNNDVSFIGDQRLENAYSTGYVSLRKFSTGGALLGETILSTWSLLSWTDTFTSDGGIPVLFGLQPWFSVGDDGLLWYTTHWTSEASQIYGTGEPPVPFDGQMLRSYNPDTGEYASYTNHSWSNESPGFTKDGLLVMWKDIATGYTAGEFFVFDPATDEAVSFNLPGRISILGNSEYFSRETVTIRTGDNFDYNGIFVGDGAQYYQLMPAGYGLTATSADFTSFDRPWETTPTPIRDTTYGVVHEATYGPFQKGDHIRLGLLLDREPAESDLCVTSTVSYVPYSVNGETNGAEWVLHDDGTITVTWGQYDNSSLFDVAETVIIFSLVEAEVISPDLVDTSIRIVTLDEVVPIRYDQAASPLPLDVNGCPNDNEGLPFRGNPTPIGG